MRNFHCCSSCIHFQVRKKGAVSYHCTRLGIETSPKYKFNCWVPKEQVRKLMEKEKRS